MSVIVLPGRCDRAAADALLAELQAAIGSEPIEIDGSKVEQIGQAVLQILLSAKAGARGVRIRPSAAFAEIGRMTGLSHQLFEEVQP